MYFKKLRKYAEIIGIAELPPDQMNPFNRRTAIVAIIFMIYLLSSTAVLVFDANTFRDYTMCAFIWMSLLFMFFGYLVMIPKAQDMFKLAKSMERMIENESDDPISADLYKTTNEKIEFWSQIAHIFCIKFFIPFCSLPLLGISYFNYIVRDMGRDSFIVLGWFKLPFDPQSPLGYVCAIAILLFLFTIVAYAIICAFGLLFGIFVLGMALNGDIVRKIYCTNSNYRITKNHAECVNGFRRLVPLGTQIKELFHGFSDSFAVVISILYVWSILAICDTLLICQNTHNVVDLLIAVVLAVIAFLLIFVFCEIGERILSMCNQIYHELWMGHWYTYPMFVQKTYSLLLLGIDKGIVLTGYANIVCTRESFKNVTTTGYSYYTMLNRV